MSDGSSNRRRGPAYQCDRRTPHNFGRLLKYGKRASVRESDFPTCAGIRAYLQEVRTRTRDYLAALSDADFLSQENNWNWELLSLFFYVSDHTYTHFGRLDQILYDKTDPRGWKCFSYSFEKKCRTDAQDSESPPRKPGNPRG